MTAISENGGGIIIVSSVAISIGINGGSSWHRHVAAA